MKILRQYLLAALLPALTVLIVGLFKKPADCGQCVLLLIVGSGLMFLVLLFLGLSYFLMFIRLMPGIFRYFLGIVATFTPPILLTWFLIKTYYNPERAYNTDFEISSPAIITAVIISSWTFYLFIRDMLVVIAKGEKANG